MNILCYCVCDITYIVFYTYITRYFILSFVSAAGSAQPQADNHAAVPALPLVDVASFVSKQDTLRAEILWTLKICAAHYSYKSSDNTSRLFAAMFPDSAIATKFTCGERKSNYMMWHGLAPYFKELLLTTVREQDAFLLLFDESYNSITKNKQMDVLVRMWTSDKPLPLLCLHGT